VRPTLTGCGLWPIVGCWAIGQRKIGKKEKKKRKIQKIINKLEKIIINFVHVSIGSAT